MSFKERLIETFGANLFKCTNCGNYMVLWEVWHHKYGIIYDTLDKSNYAIVVDDGIGKKEIEEYIFEQLELF
ncbi:hypothetical protein [Romboutsia maritimum]|uniref:hypothetical protein n=1 Tax=Romboutsia maritimum TaxID=2020948 RepID=UPI0011C03C50|nr:hypothetical protein [Romboutsia maritimum]